MKIESTDIPCGKESTEVRITQNKRKESENSYSFHVCLSTMISSIFGKSFHFPFPYFELTDRLAVTNGTGHVTRRALRYQVFLGNMEFK